MIDWSTFDRGVFLVNVLGVVYDPTTKKIIIGRRENDPNLKELSWSFPGGMPGYTEDIENYLKKEVKTKTGLDINIKTLFFAKTYPEKREFLSIYYYCTVIGGEVHVGEKFVEVKWVNPSEVTKYFTTSLHSNVLDFLKKLETDTNLV